MEPIVQYCTVETGNLPLNVTEVKKVKRESFLKMGFKGASPYAP